MFRIQRKVGFPRKVVAYYLLFCLVAICWLTAGVLVTSHTILSSRTANASLAKLGKTASALEISYLRDGKEKLNSVLQRAKENASLAYASIISPAGFYLAHTSNQLVGKPAVKPTGSLLKWGNVTGIRHVDSQGRILKEYQVPLVTNGQTLGTLHIAVEEPSIWGTFLTTARMTPIAVLLPFALVILGAFVISKLTQSVEGINSQLTKIGYQSPGTPFNPQSVSAKDVASLGWNRLVDLIEHLRKEAGNDDLNTRLADAIATRKKNEHVEILQNLSDGIAVTDSEGRIKFANRAISALLNNDSLPDEIEGTNIGDFLRDAEGTDEKLAEMLSPSSAGHAKIAEIKSQSNSVNRVLRIARQPLQGNVAKGQVWSLRDITQQKLAESMRDEFIDTATHELRTPLSNIKAYAETLVTCDTIEIEQQKEFCNIINSEVTRLARFVDDLLSISSMEVGSLSAERQKVDTARMFEEVIDKVQPLLDKKDIEFEVRLPAKMHDLHLDKDKMVAVVVNLLGNAGKYTPEGGRVALKVNLDENHLHIAVEDTGVGISEEELPHVFDKFFRSDDPRVQEESGTGLGLSLAREVVHMHGGDITVESVINQGSTFTVTLPVE